jgi:hypothetical protein
MLESGSLYSLVISGNAKCRALFLEDLAGC